MNNPLDNIGSIINSVGGESLALFLYGYV